MKRSCLLLLAAALLWPTIAVRAESPRVFFSPAERPRITAARTGSSAGTRTPSADVSIAGVAAAASGAPTKRAVLRLEGVSLARGGSAHAWIGGARYDEGSLFRGERLRVRQNGVLLVSAAGATRAFRVGESITEGAASSAQPSP